VKPVYRFSSDPQVSSESYSPFFDSESSGIFLFLNPASQAEERYTLKDTWT
jgi:hypothetical protein